MDREVKNTSLESKSEVLTEDSPVKKTDPEVQDSPQPEDADPNKDQEKLSFEDVDLERFEQERQERKRLEAERQEKKRLEREALDQERMEKVRLQKEREQKHLEKQRQESIKLKNKRAYSEQLRSGERYYMNLLRVFISLVIVLSIGCGYLYGWLYYYEKHSINGALTQYVKDVTDRKWDKVYREDSRYFTELNTKEAVTDFLFYVYGDKKPGGMTFSFANKDEKYQYYDCYYRQSYIATLQIVKPENSSVWKVRTLIGSNNYDVETINDSTFRINDIPITTDYDHDAEQVPGPYKGYELDDRLPKVTRYYIGNIVGTPAIVPENENNIVVRDHTASRYLIGPKPDAEQRSDFATAINDTAMAYCKYITEDGTLYDLKQHLLPGTVFYDAISSFNNQWFTTHESIEFKNVEIFDLLPIGENAFMGSISFDYVVTATNVQQTYSNNYQMFFIKDSSGDWKCINIYTVSNDDESPSLPNVNVETEEEEEAEAETAQDNG